MQHINDESAKNTCIGMIHFLQPSYRLLNAETKPARLLELIPLLWKKNSSRDKRISN